MGRDVSHMVSDMVGAMEAAGQRELVRSTKLPTEGSGNPIFAEMGFVFGAVDPADPLFREATLPSGWQKVGSDHAMYSYIVDTRGIRRVSVFYKAAFYDRRADMNPLSVDYANWSTFVDGKGSIPWGSLTAEERAATIVRLQEGLANYSDQTRMGQYGASATIAAKIEAELVQIGAPLSSSTQQG